MTQITKLNIKTPMCDFATGEPLPNISQTLATELGLKNNGIAYLEKDIKEHRNEIPDLTIADILNQCFDLVPLASKTQFATYNNILIDIRNAKRQNQDHIEVDKSELELLKKIFETGVNDKPEFNHKIGFVLEILEQTISNIVSKSIPPTT